MKRISLAVKGMLLALALLCAGEAVKAEQQETEDGMFGAFETWTLSGEEKDQSLFADGELNMINIWATYCGPCIQEMPELGELAGEYEEQGLQIIGIISDVVEEDSDAAEAARLIIEETKADYTHLMLSEDLYYGYLMEVQAVPTTVFVDGEGNQVGETYVGARDKKEWGQIIDELLEEVGSREAESEEMNSGEAESEETNSEEAESKETNSEETEF